MREQKGTLVTVLAIAGVVISLCAWLAPFNSIGPSPFSFQPGPRLTKASIKHLWVEHNVYEKMAIGMRIHLHFTGTNLKGENCEAAAYFYQASGAPLKDSNGLYRSEYGQVSVGQKFNPRYTPVEYENLVLFIPYAELDISKEGRYDLKFKVIIFDGQVKPIAYCFLVYERLRTNLIVILTTLTRARNSDFLLFVAC